jgi:AbrB family looped-hinge helix DNA binding protein
LILKGISMPTATMTSKGQITIPIELRKTMGLGSGDKIDFYEVEAGQFRMVPRTASIRDLKGCIPKLDHIVTIEEMNQAIRDGAAASYLKSIERPDSADSYGEAA